METFPRFSELPTDLRYYILSKDPNFFQRGRKVDKVIYERSRREFIETQCSKPINPSEINRYLEDLPVNGSLSLVSTGKDSIQTNLFTKQDDGKIKSLIMSSSFFPDSISLDVKTKSDSNPNPKTIDAAKREIMFFRKLAEVKGDTYRPDLITSINILNRRISCRNSNTYIFNLIIPTITATPFLEADRVPADAEDFNLLFRSIVYLTTILFVAGAKLDIKLDYQSDINPDGTINISPERVQRVLKLYQELFRAFTSLLAGLGLKFSTRVG